MAWVVLHGDEGRNKWPPLIEVATWFCGPKEYACEVHRVAVLDKW